jgi:hypothetical protein
MIQEVTECLQKELIDGEMNSGDIAMSFDTLFPLLMISRFAFGFEIDELDEDDIVYSVV